MQPTPGSSNAIGGAITLRAMLLDGARFADLTLFDCVSGGRWEGGLFAQIRSRPEVFAQLPDYAHEALVASHLRIDVPVRLLWGREDRITPPPLGEWLRDHIRHEDMRWIDNAGHLLQEDAPAQLLAALLRG
jgi:hypothetical protein